jgi:hypothetical protein
MDTCQVEKLILDNFAEDPGKSAEVFHPALPSDTIIARRPQSRKIDHSYVRSVRSPNKLAVPFNV